VSFATAPALEMSRFFFDLQGAQNANDPTGSAFETELDKVVLLSAGGRSRWLPCSKKLPMTDFSEITALRHCDRL
jgi:hypothetical protein